MGMTKDELNFKPRLQVINQDQIEQINSATLDVLERTGVDIPHAGALEILNDSGAKVAGNRVLMPSWLVEEAIRKAPSRIVLGTRTGKRTINLERDKTFFGTSLDCVDYLDPETHVRSRFVSENVKVTAALCDALPHLHWSMFIGMADDVPPDVADRVIARYTLEYSEKPVAFCSKDTANSKDIFEMALLLCGGKENFERIWVEINSNSPFLAGQLQTGKFDFLLIAPATSNTVAKISIGITDSLLSNAAIMGLKAFVPVYVMPSDYEEGMIVTKLPSGRDMKLRIRKEDASHAQKLAKMDDVNVIEKPENIRQIFERCFKQK